MLPASEAAASIGRLAEVVSAPNHPLRVAGISLFSRDPLFKLELLEAGPSVRGCYLDVFGEANIFPLLLDVTVKQPMCRPLKEAPPEPCSDAFFSAHGPALLSLMARFPPPAPLTFTAVPHELLPLVRRALLAAGRAVSWEEPCVTYEAPDEVLQALYSKVATAAAAARGSAEGSSSGEQLPPAPPAEPLDWAALATAVALPPEFELGPLREADAAVVNSRWKYSRGAPTQLLLAECIRARPSIAVRRRGGAAEDPSTLVAWTLQRQDGSVGVLHVREELRGRGLAGVVMSAMSVAVMARAAALRGEALARRAAADAAGDAAAAAVASCEADCLARVRPYSHIADYNTASARLFERLGYVATGTGTWVGSAALAERLWLRPIRPCVREFNAMLAHINASYKQDDAFFVDQTRTCAEDLIQMAGEGVFYVAFKLARDEAVPDADADASAGLLPSPWRRALAATPAPPGFGAGTGDAASDAALPPAPVPRGWVETPELLASVYISTGGCKVEEEAQEAAAAGAAAGAGVTKYVPRDNSAPHISMLTIHPSLKRQGIAQRVMDFLLATLKATYAAIAVEAFVVSVKPWLLRFYTDKNGFKPVGTAPWPAELEHQLILPCHFTHVRKELGSEGRE